MCGRIVWRFDHALQQWVKEWLGEADDAALQAPEVAQDRYNIPPTSTIPVARVSGDRHVLELRRWGFPLDGKPVFNTRIETAFTSPMWRSAMGDGRCLVPVTGFFEWRKDAPFFIRRSDGEPMILAGVSGWRETGDQEVPCVSIVTCAASGLVGRLHDRMPVVLEPDGAELWATQDASHGDLLDIAVPAGDVLEAFPVTPRVNSTQNDGKDLIEPLPTLDDPLA